MPNVTKRAKNNSVFLPNTEELECRFDDGEDITNFMDASTLRRPNQERYARIFPRSEEELDVYMVPPAVPRSSQKFPERAG